MVIVNLIIFRQYWIISLTFDEDTPKQFHYFGGKYVSFDAELDVDRAIQGQNPLCSDGEWVSTKEE